MDLGSSLGVVGVVVSVPGLIDVCLELGKQLAKMVHDYRERDDVAKELALKYKAVWGNLELILDDFNRTTERLSGTPFEKEIYDMLTMLQTKLMKGLEKAARMNLFTPPHLLHNLGMRNRLQIAWSRSDLEILLKEAQEWEELIHKRRSLLYHTRYFGHYMAQGMHGPVKRLLSIPPHTSMAQSRIDWKRDVEEVRLNGNNFVAEAISWSSLRYLRSKDKSSDSYLVEDFRPTESANFPRDIRDYPSFQQDVCDTAKMLKGADPRFMSILQCRGVFENKEEGRFELFYSVPPYLSAPRSLRDLLTDNCNNNGILHPLDHRIRLANCLATAILYVHSEGHFVHKHINPQNIIVFNVDDGPRFPWAIGYPFLVGFDRSRSESGMTSKRGELQLVRCVYQHPQRWGERAESRFRMLHDVYSLGVVLLEVGLWEPFVSQDRICWKELGDLFEMRNGKQVLTRGTSPVNVQQRFIDKAKELLPPKLGRKYTNVVVSCLSGNLDEGLELMGNDLEQKEGLGYIRNVVTRLEKLRIFIDN